MDFSVFCGVLKRKRDYLISGNPFNVFLGLCKLIRINVIARKYLSENILHASAFG